MHDILPSHLFNDELSNMFSLQEEVNAVVLNFKSVLESKDLKLIEIAWNSPFMQSGLVQSVLADKNPVINVALDIRISLYIMALQQGLLPITTCLFNALDLQKWYQQQLDQQIQRPAPKPSRHPILMSATKLQLALHTRDVPLIKEIWTDNLELKSLFAGLNTVDSIPFADRKAMFISVLELESELELVFKEITDMLLLNPDIKNWRHQQLEEMQKKARRTPGLVNATNGEPSRYRIKGVVVKVGDEVISPPPKFGEVQFYLRGLISADAIPGLHPLMNAIRWFETTLIENPGFFKAGHNAGSYSKQLFKLFPELVNWYVNPNAHSELKAQMPKKLGIWKIYELALINNNVPLIRMIKKNPDLCPTLAGKVPETFIPFKTLVEIFKRTSSLSVIKALWENLRIQGWYMGKGVNISDIPDSEILQTIPIRVLIKEYLRLSFQEKESNQSNLNICHKIARLMSRNENIPNWFKDNGFNSDSTEESLQECIPMEDLHKFLETQVKRKQPEYLVLENLVNNIHFQHWYISKPVVTIWERFLYLLNQETILVPMIRHIVNNVPAISAHIRGMPLPADTGLNPPLSTEKQMEVFVLLLDKCGDIAEQVWHDSITLQKAIQSMHYEPFKKLLINIYDRFSDFSAFLATFKDIKLLQCFREEKVERLLLCVLIDQHINTVNIPRILDAINRLNAALQVGDIPLTKEIWVEDLNIKKTLAGLMNGISIPSSTLQEIYKNASLLKLTNIVDTLRINLSLEQLVQRQPQAFIEREPSIANEYPTSARVNRDSIGDVIQKFEALLDEKPIRTNDIITFWLHNPILLRWLGAKKLDCFGISNNVITLDRLIKSFIAALEDPWGCRYLLEVMLQGSMSLRQWLRNLPLESVINNINLCDCFAALVESKSTYMVNLIWVDNTKLQTAIRNLDSEALSAIIASVLDNFSPSKEKIRTFLGEFIENIENIENPAVLENGDVLRKSRIQKIKNQIEPVILKKRKFNKSEEANLSEVTKKSRIERQESDSILVNEDTVRSCATPEKLLQATSKVPPNSIIGYKESQANRLFGSRPRSPRPYDEYCQDDIYTSFLEDETNNELWRDM